MPSVRYMNQTAPFWDFVANLEEQGASHPWFAGQGQADEVNQGERPNPWTDGWAAFPHGPFAHRGRRGPPHAHHGAPQHTADEEMEESSEEKAQEPEAGPSEPRASAPLNSDSAELGRGAGPRRGGRCGGRGRGAAGARGRGPCGAGARGRGGFPFGRFGPLGAMFQNQFAGPDASYEDGIFSPEVDVFDTPESFVIHVSLPGAKKEEVGVNWDTEKSELSIAGVVTRPGDEEFLKTLAMDERKIGAFERKIRLGSRASPALVEVDSISARMEDGILRIDVPKLDSGYVEVKKVDIE